jgi:predicted TPR repeat methyltransferase
LGKALFHLGRIDEAEAAYRRSIEINPQSNSAYTNLVDLLRRTGKFEEACEAARQWKESFPDNPIARHTWASLTGEGARERAEEAYVRQLFDEFADNFDATLAKLEYQAPRLTAAALSAALPPDAAGLEILDAGCGTGLCGPLLRQRAGRLTGVDLSRGMLEKAHSRRVYDALIQEEITTYLRQNHEAFDAIVAADTLNYFGALEEVLTGAAGALRPKGIFVFTLEKGDLQDGWRLHEHGRYSQSRAYLDRAIAGAGLELESLAQAELRMEGVLPAHGWIVTARRAISPCSSSGA